MPPSGINTDERTQITLTTNGSNTITATAGNALQNQNPYGISGIQTLLGADVTLSAGKDNLISVNSNDAYSSGISVGTIASGEKPARPLGPSPSQLVAITKSPELPMASAGVAIAASM